MRSPITSLLSIGLAFAPAFAGTVSNQNVFETASSSEIQSSTQQSKEFAKILYARGEARQNLGRIMSWGGLGLSVAGSLMNAPAVSSIGSLSLLIGIPVNGSGAGTMIDAANMLNPNANLEMRGWGTYGASWVLIGGGTALLIASVAGADNVDEVNTTALGVGVVSLVAGQIMQYVAWGQFSGSADRAELIHGLAYSVDVTPTLYASRTAIATPGVQVSLKF